MSRLPILLIVFFLIALLAGIVCLGVSFGMTAILQYHRYSQVAASLFLPAFGASILLGLVLWIWALIHLLTNRDLWGTDKLVWMFAIVLFNVVGSILYFLLSPCTLNEQSWHSPRRQ